MGITPFFREFGGGHHKNFYGFFTWDFFFWVASAAYKLFIAHASQTYRDN